MQLAEDFGEEEVGDGDTVDSGIDTSVDEDDDPTDEQGLLIDPSTVGLKEISNLGKFTVSSHKPGNGVEELRNEDLKMYWQ
jgi:anaphase-promoting complex subunit 10